MLLRLGNKSLLSGNWHEANRCYNPSMTKSSRVWTVNAVILITFALIGLKAVNEPKNDFRFAIMGDRTGGAQPQIYGRVWREIDLMHPEFVVNVGDTIQGKEDEMAESQWMEAAAGVGALQPLPALLHAGQP